MPPPCPAAQLFHFGGPFAAAPNPRLDLASHEHCTRNLISDSCSSSHVHKLFRDATTFQARKHLLQLPFLSPRDLFPAQWGQNHVAWISQTRPMEPAMAGAQALACSNTSKQLSHHPPTLCFLALTLSIGRGCHDSFHMRRFVAMGVVQPWSWLPQKESHHEL